MSNSLHDAQGDWRRFSAHHRKVRMDMRDPILQVVYVSDHAPDLKSREIAAFGDTARDRAGCMGLTGLLTSQGSKFMEVLEGPSSAVIARLEEISADTRHVRMCILRESAVTEQRFANWFFGNLSTVPEHPDAAEDASTFGKTLSQRLRSQTCCTSCQGS